MRISDVSNVTGIPLGTLKDLRHRSILELAVGGLNEDPDEIRRWGSFSAPAVMFIMGADDVRKRYGMSWQDAMAFAKDALNGARSIGPNGEFFQFFDLGAIDREIWAGRFEFRSSGPESFNYFSGAFEELPQKLDQVIKRRAAAQQGGEAVGCIMLNASQLVREFWRRAKEHNAGRDWENR